MRGKALPGLVLALAGLAPVILYLPALKLTLFGDDFLLVQLAHRAEHSFPLLFASLDAFYRPTTTWTLILDRSIWGTFAGGFHLTNILLRVASAILMIKVGRKLGFGSIIAGVIATLWSCSAFSAEPVWVVGSRIDEQFMLAWLLLIIAWPEPDQGWRPPRIAAVIAITAFAALSKETWIVTPGLVWGLEFGYRRTSFKQALRLSGLFALAVALYMTAHFALLPGPGGYMTFSIAPISKITHMAAAFFYLETLVPIAFAFSLKGAVATAILAALIWYGLVKHNIAVIIGACLLALPLLPTLFVPYLPVRYTAIPYAGFLLILVGAGQTYLMSCQPRIRLGGAIAAVGLALLLFTAGAFTVRADLRDAERVSRAHEKLLDEARGIVAQLPVKKPVVVVRQENDNPLLEISLSPQGMVKLLPPRHDDAYGLTDTAAMFEWLLARPHVFVRRLERENQGYGGVPGAAMAHRTGGFVWLSHAVPDAFKLAATWRAQGLHARVIVLEED